MASRQATDAPPAAVPGSLPGTPPVPAVHLPKLDSHAGRRVMQPQGNLPAARAVAALCNGNPAAAGTAPGRETVWSKQHMRLLPAISPVASSVDDSSAAPQNSSGDETKAKKHWSSASNKMRRMSIQSGAAMGMTDILDNLRTHGSVSAPNIWSALVVVCDCARVDTLSPSTGGETRGYRAHHAGVRKKYGASTKREQ